MEGECPTKVRCPHLQEKELISMPGSKRSGAPKPRVLGTRTGGAPKPIPLSLGQEVNQLGHWSI